MRVKKGPFRVISACLALFLLAEGLAAQPAEPVEDWPVPESEWTPPDDLGLESATPTAPLQFIGTSPCRLVDTRRADLPAGYGTPSMSDKVARTFVMTGRPHCFIPDAARAISINITVVRPTGPGYLSLYPSGESALVATINFQKDVNIANAAITPLGSDGGVTMLVAFAKADLVIDVNGYFAEAQTLIWRGAWNSSVPYAIGDLVSHAGSSWVSRTAGNQGIAPSAGAAVWNLVAQKGDGGAPGPQGPPGPQGLQGPQGPAGPAGSSPWQANSGILSYNGGAVGLGTSTAPNPNNPNDHYVKLDIENGNLQVDAERGLVAEGGAKVVTGPGGGTFRFIAGSSPNNDIAYFMDSTGTKKVAIDSLGAIQFGYQKVCSVLVGNTWRDTLLVPSTWTAATCDRMRTMLGASAYQLACIFENDFSLGKGSGIPAPNCGW